MLPVRIRQFPQFVRQMTERAHLLHRPYTGHRTFRLCFFSCQSYFRYLYCSLHSLTRHVKSHPVEVLVFSDEEQPLSDAQIDAIRQLIPGTRVILWPKSMGWGTKQIQSIWRAYALATKGANADDIVARVDSDVFFFNETIFDAVARSDADYIGDGHFVDFKYCQGGCYFFRVSAVRRINQMIEQESIESIAQEVDVVVEDVIAYRFAERLGLKIWMTWFMMFPDELRIAGGLTAWQRWKYSCLHFVMKNKAAMLHAYDREVLSSNPPESYSCAMEIE